MKCVEITCKGFWREAIISAKTLLACLEAIFKTSYTELSAIGLTSEQWESVTAHIKETLVISNLVDISSCTNGKQKLGNKN